jgi:hypothetical protein
MIQTGDRVFPETNSEAVNGTVPDQRAGADDTVAWYVYTRRYSEVVRNDRRDC